jgi:hypothetical protein
MRIEGFSKSLDGGNGILDRRERESCGCAARNKAQGRYLIRFGNSISEDCALESPVWSEYCMVYPVNFSPLGKRKSEAEVRNELIDFITCEFLGLEPKYSGGDNISRLQEPP